MSNTAPEYEPECAACGCHGEKLQDSPDPKHYTDEGYVCTRCARNWEKAAYSLTNSSWIVWRMGDVEGWDTPILSPCGYVQSHDFSFAEIWYPGDRPNEHVEIEKFEACESV